MPKFTLEVSISDDIFPFLEAVRDSMPHEHFYRNVFGIGISTVMENAVRRSLDHLHKRLYESNHDYEKAIAVLRVEPPPPEASPKAEIMQRRTAA